jgi:energy-coupling factor transporter ATP-binding protein EcfA2
LTPNDGEENGYQQTYDLAARKRTEGTCEWLRSHSTFQMWKNEQKNSILWLNGGSGCGKTTAMAYLTSILKEEGPITIHRFCGRSGRGDTDDLMSACRSLMYQVWSQSTASSAMDQFWAAVENSRKGFEGAEFWRRLLYDMFLVLSSWNRVVVIVLDAIDECDNGKTLLHWLIQFTNSPRVPELHLRLKLLVSSRLPDVSLEHLLSNAHIITLDRTDSTSNNYGDIYRCLETSLFNGMQCGRLKRFDDTFVRYIVERISRESRGM